MRAIQSPQHGWEKINLMNSGCEGEKLFWGIRTGNREERRQSAATWQLSGARLSSGLGFPAGVKHALRYIRPWWLLQGTGTVCGTHPGLLSGVLVHFNKPLLLTCLFFLISDHALALRILLPGKVRQNYYEI